MRLSEWLFAQHAPGAGRNQQLEHRVPWREILPLKLKDRVSGKYDTTRLGGCLFEMTLIITCLQNNEYESRLCAKETEKFKTCYDSFLKSKRETQAAQSKNLLVPGDRNLTFRQIQKLLKKRPLA